MFDQNVIHFFVLSLSEYQISHRKKSHHHNGFNSAYELDDDNEDELFKGKTRKPSQNKSNSIGTNGADHSFDFCQDEYSHNSSNASNNNNKLQTNLNGGSQPELLITSPNKYTNYYNSNHNLVNNTSRARIAQENLQRLEREKDDLYEL